MAFNSDYLYLDRATTNSTTPEVGVAMHKYKNVGDTLAAITASGYFNAAYQTPPANNANAPIQMQVGDAFLIQGSDGTAYYIITAVTPNVTVAALPVQAGVIVKSALVTTTGGSATFVVSLPGLGITASSVALAVIHTVGATPRTITSVAAGTNNVTVVFSGDPSTDHVINLVVFNVAP